MSYLCGDTIRLHCIVKNMDGDEEAPASISLNIDEQAGSSIVSVATPDLESGTTSHYYYDFTIPSYSRKVLIATWLWSGPHKKKIRFDVNESGN